MKRLTLKDLSVAITPKEHSELEIEITCPAEVFSGYRSRALKDLGNDMSLPGFRKGHIPEKILAQTLGEDRVLSEMADIVIQDAYIATVAEKRLDPIGAPRITVTKMASGNELTFRINISVVPEVKLPDYKDIALKVFGGKKESFEAEEPEIDKALAELQKRYAQMKHKRTDIKDEELPSLDDAFAKSLGEFEDLSGLRAHVKGEIIMEKKSRERDRARMQVLEDIIAGMTIDLPSILIEGELDRMVSEFEHTLSRTGAKLEDYLAQTKTTRESLRASWKKDAEKRVKGQFALAEISKKEKIFPPEEHIAKEVELLSRHYKNADPARLRGYVEMMLGNDAVFSFLEGQDATKQA